MTSRAALLKPKVYSASTQVIRLRPAGGSATVSQPARRIVSARPSGVGVLNVGRSRLVSPGPLLQIRPSPP